MIQKFDKKTVMFGYALLILIASTLSGLVWYLFPHENSIVAVAIGANVVLCLGLVAAMVRMMKSPCDSADTKRADWAEEHIASLQKHSFDQEKTIKVLKEDREKFRHAAFHDPLTGLANRNLFLESLSFILEKHKQQSSYNFAVLSVDIKRFKAINDSLGHSNGDKLIKAVGERLQKAVRKGDLVSRSSGDEFSVILDNVRSLENAIVFAKAISKAVADPFSLAGRTVHIRVSIGVAMCNKGYLKAEDVLTDADIAMYYAKQEDKEYKVFDQAMHHRVMSVLQLETDLRSAVEREEFVSYFQPIVALDDMSLAGFESLIRWKHPIRGLVPPGEFIPASEETGLIIPMTLWMIRNSCEKLLEWKYKNPGGRPLFLSVNLSTKHFLEGNLVSEVQKILVETQIDPSQIKLELTESVMMENVETVLQKLHEFRALGLKLSIDDFGTGYSSLSYLHRFPADTLKIDRSFVSTMENGSENGEIVRTIIALAKNLHLNIVAEGVETIDQLHQLRVLGCEYGQGYLFAKPVPPEEIDEMLKSPKQWQKLIPQSPAKPRPPATGPQQPLLNI